MLRFEQCTTPLPFNGAVALLEHFLQIGRLGKGRLQLGVLVLSTRVAVDTRLLRAPLRIVEEQP